MIKNWQNTFACFLALLFGFFLFYIGTDGFHAYTEETARVNKLIEEKPRFPDVILEDSKGRVYPITKFEGKYVLMTFLYTSCTSVCPRLEMNMSQLYHLIPSKNIGKDIIFLSISFDPARDDPSVLNRYKNAFHSDGETWRMARIKKKSELDSLLKAFGVIVIPDENGNFTHNAAFYLVDKTGRLVDVMDYTKIHEDANKIVRILKKNEGE